MILSSTITTQLSKEIGLYHLSGVSPFGMGMTSAVLSCSGTSERKKAAINVKFDIFSKCLLHMRSRPNSEFSNEP